MRIEARVFWAISKKVPPGARVRLRFPPRPPRLGEHTDRSYAELASLARDLPGVEANRLAPLSGVLTTVAEGLALP